MTTDRGPSMPEEASYAWSPRAETTTAGQGTRKWEDLWVLVYLFIVHNEIRSLKTQMNFG